MARILSLTTRQLRNLEGEGLPCRAVKNQKRYRVAECVKWYVARKLQELREASNLDALKARKLEAEAADKELALAERRKVLMLVTQHREILGLVCDRIRNRVMAWAATLPPQLVGLESEREMQAVIAPAVDDVLEQLQTVGDDPPEERDGEAA